MSSFLQDVRYACRSLRRSAGLTAVRIHELDPTITVVDIQTMTCMMRT